MSSDAAAVFVRLSVKVSDEAKALTADVRVRAGSSFLAGLSHGLSFALRHPDLARQALDDLTFQMAHQLDHPAEIIERSLVGVVDALAVDIREHGVL